MNWIQRKFAQRKAHQKLKALITEYLPEDYYAGPRMLNEVDVDRITRESAHRLCLLIEENAVHRTDIVCGFGKMGNTYFGLEHRVELVLKHFGFASSLDTCAPADVIDRALGNMDNIALSLEQEQALVRLESSRWAKTRRAGTGEQPLHHYEAFVTRAVIERPQDVGRIVELAQRGKCESLPQINAVLDARVAVALSEGAL